MTTKLEISEPILIVPETTSISTMASTVVPYYGSRAPKQSVIETDRIIIQMIDDLQVNILPEKQEWNATTTTTTTRSMSTTYIMFWKLRIVLCSIFLLLLVVATVVFSELTKEKDHN